MKKNVLALMVTSAVLTLSGCSSVNDSYSENVATSSQNDPLTMETLFNDSSVIYIEEDLEEEKNAILTERNGHYSAETFLYELNKKGVDLSVIENSVIEFNFDSTDLSSISKALISEHVNLLKESSELKVILEGHTDSTGDRSYNLKLGERRALAVKQYALTLGALPHQVEVISYGEEKLLNEEKSEQEMKNNRRAVFVYK